MDPCSLYSISNDEIPARRLSLYQSGRATPYRQLFRLHSRAITAEGKVNLTVRLGNLARIRWVVSGLGGSRASPGADKTKAKAGPKRPGTEQGFSLFQTRYMGCLTATPPSLTAPRLLVIRQKSPQKIYDVPLLYSAHDAARNNVVALKEYLDRRLRARR